MIRASTRVRWNGPKWWKDVYYMLACHFSTYLILRYIYRTHLANSDVMITKVLSQILSDEELQSQSFALQHPISASLWSDFKDVK